jgi:hypothetical protein
VWVDVSIAKEKCGQRHRGGGCKNISVNGVSGVSCDGMWINVCANMQGWGTCFASGLAGTGFTGKGAACDGAFSSATLGRAASKISASWCNAVSCWSPMAKGGALACGWRSASIRPRAACRVASPEDNFGIVNRWGEFDCVAHSFCVGFGDENGVAAIVL